MDGRAAVEAGRTQPLYRLPWSTIFPCAIAAGLIGIAEGVLEHALEYQTGRVNAVGMAQVSDPHTRRTLGEAAADLRGARTQLLYDVGELYEAHRRRARGHHGRPCRHPARPGAGRAGGPWRRPTRPSPAAAATPSGSTSPSSASGARCTPGMNHAVFVAGPVYDDAAGMLMGEDPSGPASVTF